MQSSRATWCCYLMLGNGLDSIFEHVEDGIGPMSRACHTSTNELSSCVCKIDNQPEQASIVLVRALSLAGLTAWHAGYFSPSCSYGCYSRSFRPRLSIYFVMIPVYHKPHRGQYRISSHLRLRSSISAQIPKSRRRKTTPIRRFIQTSTTPIFSSPTTRSKNGRTRL
jgi:hypothetical protein